MLIGDFVNKWLGNPEKQYDEHNRNEMRDDIFKIIARHNGDERREQMKNRATNIIMATKKIK